YRGGHRPPGRRLAGEALRRAQHRPRPRHCGHRRPGGGPQRGHGDGEPGAVRVQAGGLSQALQEQGPHLLPEPRRLRQPGELRQQPGSGERPLLQGPEERQHQPLHPVLPQFLHPLQPAHRLRPEGGRADQHAGQRPDPGPA
ncbi:putative protein conserved in bacteria, partial [Dysosmobacter welbionis]